MMYSVVAGVIMTVASTGLFLVIRPRHGVTHRWSTAPVLDWVLPMMITSGLVLGAAMIISGIASMTPL